MGLPTTRSTTRECERIGATQFVFSNKTFFNDLYQEGGEEKKRREGGNKRPNGYAIECTLRHSSFSIIA
jgi:hypothetical protein